MFDDIVEYLKKILNSRFIPIVIIYVSLFSVLVVRLFNLQIVGNDSLTTTIDESSTAVRELKSTRGRILDCNGKVLAYNKLSYTITIQDDPTLDTNEKINEVIYTLLKILDKNNTELASTFFIKLNDDGTLSYRGGKEAELAFKRDVFSLRTVDELTDEQVMATPIQVYEFMRTGTGFEGYDFTSMYEISDKYEVKDALRIMQIRYYLMLNKYSRYKPITVSSNVNSTVVSAINEYSAELPGVNILEQTHRVYNDSECFAHIMGYTGLITNDDLNKYNTDKDNPVYSATDQIGKTGIEFTMEEYLRGTKGYETVVLNSKSQITEISSTVEPVAGDDIYLSIDADLQKACYTLLEKELASILLAKIDNVKSYKYDEDTDSSKIRIPIYDVYFALIDNYLVDTDHFSSDDASELEKKAYNDYLNERERIFNKLQTLLAYDSKTLPSKLDEDTNTYLEYIYKYLKSNDVLMTSKIDTSDETYKEYVNDKISLSEFLQYAFSKDWINLEKLNVEDSSFYSTKELYSILTDYIFDRLKTDTDFSHFVYKVMVYSDKLSGKTLGLILYDQGYLKEDEKTYNQLKSGNLTAYAFMLKKIKSLELTPGDLGLDPCSGSIVITDPNTGKVKAMVTYPAYDNNMLANSIDAKYYNLLLNKNSDVLVNRATQTLTAPGSTFKICSAIAGLESNVISTSTEIYDKHVFTKLEGTSPKCNGYHGTINVSEAIMVSCNYFFYDVGYKLSLNGKNEYKNDMGLNKLSHYASTLGFDKKSGIEISEYEPKISDTDSIRSAIGQGTNAYAPIQISRYITSVANRGTVYDLTLIDKITTVDNEIVVKNDKASVYKNAEFKKSTWDAVHKGLYLVVNGPKSSIDEYFKDMSITVAGKTGTAQQIKTRGNHALFVSYAPYEKPEISVTCVIPFGYTSHNAAELASSVYKYYFKENNSEDLLDNSVDASTVDGGYTE